MAAKKVTYILIVDDDPTVIARFKNIFNDDETMVFEYAKSGEEAISKVKIGPYKYSVILVDCLMPSMKGDEVTRRLLKVNPYLFIAMNSADESREALKRCVQAGAQEFILKSFSSDEIKRDVLALCKKYEQFGEIVPEENIITKKRELIASTGIIGDSDQLALIASFTHRAAATDCNVLVSGESGTGKELIARAIHNLSKRKSMNFVSVNMTAIAENLFESTMFGHIKGAFTSAINNNVGLFKSANGGTIFLDEIGDMPLNNQAKLLRVIQEGEIMPVGSNKVEKVNVRIIAATNRNLEECMKQNTFREDLYYRLNVLPIHVPPLRDRTDDIRPLVYHFKRKFKGSEKVISKAAFKRLERYPWPGNVRELEAEIERMLILANEDFITEKHLSAKLLPYDNELEPMAEIDIKQFLRFSHKELSEKFKEIEAMYLTHKSAQGSLREVSREIDIPLSTLQDKIKTYGITKGEPVKKNNKVLIASLIGLALPAHGNAMQVSKDQVAAIGEQHDIQNLPADATNVGLLVETDIKDVYTINPAAFKQMHEDAINEKDEQTIELLRELAAGASTVRKVDAKDFAAGSQDCGGGTSGAGGVH